MGICSFNIKFYQKKYCFVKLLSGIIILTIGFSNISWINQFGILLDNIQFPLIEWANPSKEFELDNKILILSNGNLKIKNEESFLLTKIDSFLISEKKNKAVGILQSGELFEILIIDEKLMIKIKT